MEPTSPKPQDIVDTTDSLEAVGASKSMKNFLFFLIFICLLVTQVIFWLNRLGLIEQNSCKSCAMQKASCDGCTKPAEKASQPAPSGGPLALAATADIEKVAEKVAGEVEQSQQTAQAEADEGIILEKIEDRIPPDVVVDESAAEEKIPFKISARFCRIIVAICNFLVILGSILYCLTLLMCLKISLTGRLGGINHITKAFFISLFLVIVLFPWQRILPGVLVGSIWMPGELLCGGWEKAQGSAIWKVLFYLRFCGLWILAIWLLFWTQMRSARWAHATLRRLGVVR